MPIDSIQGLQGFFLLPEALSSPTVIAPEDGPSWIEPHNLGFLIVLDTPENTQACYYLLTKSLAMQW